MPCLRDDCRLFPQLVTACFLNFRTILVKMLSQAGTGFCFNAKRNRLQEKLTLLHFDPIGKTRGRCSTVSSDASKDLLPFPDSCWAFLAVLRSFWHCSICSASTCWTFTMAPVTLPGAGCTRMQSTLSPCALGTHILVWKGGEKRKNDKLC